MDKEGLQWGEIPSAYLLASLYIPVQCCLTIVNYLHFESNIENRLD